MVRGHIQVREITPAAAGDADLRACPRRMVEHQHRAAAFSAFNCAEQTRRASANDDDVF